MRYVASLVASLLILGGAAQAQTQVCLPDSNAATGSCQVPFLSQTWVWGIPASSLDPANPQVHDIANAACVSGSSTLTSFTMAIGHVPSPLPFPFTMPVFGPGGSVVSTGSFLDVLLVYDSSVQGPLTLQVTANTWASFGFAATGGTGFTWDGVNDIAIYGSMVATNGLDLRYSPNGPLSYWEQGYLQPTATGQGSMGTKLCLEVRPLPLVNNVGTACPSANGVAASLSANGLPSIGNGGFSLAVTSANPNTMATLFPSLGVSSTPFPLGAGCFAYLDLVSMTNLTNSGFGPFFQTTNGSGQATFSMPVPNVASLAGLQVWFQCALNDPSLPLGFSATNAVRCEIW